MTQHLRLRLHVTEPWDFERTNGTNELTGWTIDYADEENEEWEVTLDHPIEFHERHIRTLLVGPRYVGEHLRRIFDAVVGFPVRVAHRQDGDWHYAMTAALSLPREEEK
jgi:ketol-acid reductoisomerase